jgi:hypothetical protein
LDYVKGKTVNIKTILYRRFAEPRSSANRGSDPCSVCSGLDIIRHRHPAGNVHYAAL